MSRDSFWSLIEFRGWVLELAGWPPRAAPPKADAAGDRRGAADQVTGQPDRSRAEERRADVDPHTGLDSIAADGAAEARPDHPGADARPATRRDGDDSGDGNGGDDGHRSLAPLAFGHFVTGAAADDRGRFPGPDPARGARSEGAAAASQGLAGAPAATNGPSALFPADPDFGLQWYLHNTVTGQFDINVIDVWNDYTGDGVEITVVDNGIRLTHEEIDVLVGGNYLGADYDYIDSDFDPSFVPGVESGSHGMEVLGIIAALEGNGKGGVGVAYGAGIRAFRTDYNNRMAEANLDAAGLGDAFGNPVGGFFGSDIINQSYGLTASRGNVLFFLSDVVDANIRVTNEGRGGLGTIVVKSNGNNKNIPFSLATNPDRFDAVAEHANTQKETLSVAAIRADGWSTSYNSYGANLLISAFGDDAANQPGIRAPSVGSNSDYSMFNGTSAAAPEVSGVVALMLEANPDLGWRDVQMILANSARHVGSAVGSAANTGAPANGAFEIGTQANGATWFLNAAKTWNGGGLHFSNDYGFGLVDAKAAVRLAETWTRQSTSANDVIDTNLVMSDFGGFALPDGGVSPSTFVTTVDAADNIVVEHISVDVNFTTQNLSDFHLHLTSPGGTTVRLLADTGVGQARDFRFTSPWPFGSTAFMGEQSVGDWTVSLRDDTANALRTTVFAISLELGGAAATEDDTFILTRELSDFFAASGHSSTINGNDGIDTLNAAAVDTNSVINLQSNTGVIDATLLTIFDIERVYTGDGNDFVTGDSVSRFISTGRGQDFVTGGAGPEVIYGGPNNSALGIDFLDGGGGDDTIFGGDGQDVLEGSAGADILYGGDDDSNDGFRYQAGIAAADAADTVFGGGGAFDYLEIAGAGTVDLRQLSVDSIERIFMAFNGPNNDLVVQLSNRELDEATEFSPTLLITGNDEAGSDDRVEVFLDSVSTVTGRHDVNLSGWTFQAWVQPIDAKDNADLLLIYGGNSPTDTGNTNDNSIVGTSKQDTILAFGGDDTIEGGPGPDSISGGPGEDTASYLSSPVGVIVELLATTQSLGDAQGDILSEIENLIGSVHADLLSGDGNPNDLFGGAGNDLLNGRGGADRLFGGADADIFDVLSSEDGPGNTYDGGDALDEIITRGISGALTVDLRDDTIVSVERLRVGTAGLNVTTHLMATQVKNGFQTFRAAPHAGGTAVVAIRMGFEFDLDLAGLAVVDFNEIGDGIRVFGTVSTDSIAGSSIADTILAGDGDDTVVGSVGADSLDGGDGDSDHLSYSRSNVGVTVNLGTASVSGGHATGDTIARFENVIGSVHNDTITGNVSNNTLEGGGGADSLDGVAGKDTLSYRGSNAGVTVNLGTGSVSGGDANGDTLGSAFANAIGSVLADTITGSGGDNTIEGGGGGDSMSGGGGGIDTLSYASSALGVAVDLNAGTFAGGDAQGDTATGFRHIIGGWGDNSLTGDGQANFIDGGSGTDSLFGGAGNDMFLFDEGRSDFGGITDGGDDFDTLLFEGGVGSHIDFRFSTLVSIEALTFLGTATGVDVILPGEFFGGGGISFTAAIGGNAAFGNNIFSALGMGTTLDLSGLTFTDWGGPKGDILSFFGDNDAETITGTSQDDTIRGFGGDDTLNAGAGNDTVEGGDGNDLLIGGSGAGNDTYRGDADIDTLSYASTTQGVAVTLTAGTGQATGPEIGTDVIEGVENVTGGSGNDRLIGNAAANVLTGNGGADSLFGGDQDDTIFGGAGNDHILGGRGADSINGGDQIDTVDYRDFAGGVRVDLFNGVGQFNFAHGDSYASIENVIGSTVADVLIGDSGNNVLNGWLGADIIDGGLGIDTVDFTGAFGAVKVDLAAGRGFFNYAEGDRYSRIENVVGGGFNDILIGDGGINVLTGAGGNDTLAGGLGGDTLNGGDGIDTVDYTGNFGAVRVDLQAGVGQFNFAQGDVYIGVENAIGTSFGDWLIGNGAANTLSGGDGADSIVGGAGADALFGDGGANSLFGGDQDDTIFGGAGNDHILGGRGADSINGGDQIDTVDYRDFAGGVRVDLFNGVGQFNFAHGDSYASIENAIGSTVADVLIGDSGNNVLNGWLGADIIDGGLGIDTVDFTGAFGAVKVDLAAGRGFFNYAEGDRYSRIENVVGGGFNDILIGDGGINVLTGAGGNDTLAGGLGGDTLNGGDGIDTVDYTGNFGAVRVDLQAGVGQFNFAQGDVYIGVENAIGTSFGDWLIGNGAANTLSGGDGADSIVGGAGADVLFGDGGANSLFGGDQDDTIFGGAGNDHILGGRGADSINGGDQVDTVDYRDFAGGVRVDLFNGVGQFNFAHGDSYASIENVIGSTAADTLIGTSGNNVLNGWLGADSIDGGAGIDTVDFTGAFGAVKVDLAAGRGFFNYAEGDRYSRIENVVGGGFNDILIGDGGTNVLTGAGGNDTLAGGFGNDTLTGSGGADFFVFGAAREGNDVITDFVSGLDKLDVRGLSTSAANVNVTDLGADQLVSFSFIAGITITLQGIADPSGIDTVGDFIFA